MTSTRAFTSRRIAGAFAILTAVSGLATPASAAGPFQQFVGKWKGGGTVTTSSGREAIRCRSRYRSAGGGNTLKISVNCASDSYRVNIVSHIVAEGSTFTGSWEETTRQLSGDVSGRIPEPNTFQASLETIGGGLQIGARTNGARQAITITSQGSDIQGASITLKKKK